MNNLAEVHKNNKKYLNTSEVNEQTLTDEASSLLTANSDCKFSLKDKQEVVNVYKIGENNSNTHEMIEQTEPIGPIEQVAAVNSTEDNNVWKVINVDRRKISEHVHSGLLSEELFLEAEADLHEKQEWIDRDVEALRDLVQAEEGLRSRIDKPFLLTFLRARKFDYEKALNMIRGYYRIRYDNAELFLNLNPVLLDHVWKYNIQHILPQPDVLGRTVLIFRTSAWNTQECSLDDLLRGQMLYLEHIVRLPITQLRGVTAIVDCEGLSMSHAYYLTPTHIKRVVSLIQEVFPLRFKALHFIHEPSIFDWTFSLIKPFLSNTIQGRLHFHGEDISSLHNHVPKCILPKEFDGDGPPVSNKEFLQILKSEEQYFEEHFSYGYDKIEQPVNASPTSPSMLRPVYDVGSYLGSYYRRMCIE